MRVKKLIGGKLQRKHCQLLCTTCQPWDSSRIGGDPLLIFCCPHSTQDARGSGGGGMVTTHSTNGMSLVPFRMTRLVIGLL